MIDRAEREVIGFVNLGLAEDNCVYRGIARESELLPNVLFIPTVRGIIMVDKDTCESKLLFKQN